MATSTIDQGSQSDAEEGQYQSNQSYYTENRAYCQNSIQQLLDNYIIQSSQDSDLLCQSGKQDQRVRNQELKLQKSKIFQQLHCNKGVKQTIFSIKQDSLSFLTQKKILQLRNLMKGNKQKVNEQKIERLNEKNRLNFVKQINSFQSNKLLGGGGCAGSRIMNVQEPKENNDVDKKQQIISKNLTELKKVRQKQAFISSDFLECYNKYISDQQRKQDTIEQQYEVAEMHAIFANCINEHRQFISINIEIFDTFLQYMILSADRDSSLTEDIVALSNLNLVIKQYNFNIQFLGSKEGIDSLFPLYFLIAPVNQYFTIKNQVIQFLFYSYGYTINFQENIFLKMKKIMIGLHFALVLLAQFLYLFNFKYYVKGKQIKLFNDYILQRVTTNQCQDLAFFTQFLLSLNDQRIGLDEQNLTQIEKIIKVMSVIIKLGVNIASIATGVGSFTLALNALLTEGGDLINTIKQIAKSAQSAYEGVQGLIQSEKDVTKLVSKDAILKQLASVTAQKVQFLGSKEKANIEDEIEFYIDKMIELSGQKASNQFILYILTQINYLLEKGGLGSNKKASSYSDFADRLAATFLISNPKVKEFFNLLQQKSNQKKFYEEALLFFKFSVFDPTYRYLANQILLKFKVILDHSRSSKEEKDNFAIHLLYSYVTEKNEAVKVVFQNNQDFVDFVNLRLQKEKEEIASKIMKAQQERKADFIMNQITSEELGKIEDLIQNEQDFLNRIALKLIEKWEIDVKQRLEKDIALKDDALLEVQDLYINQRISYLKGKDIFNQKDSESRSNKNAIETILQDFLKPNYQKQSLSSEIEKQPQQNNKNIKKEIKNSNEQQNQTCRILAILAEGGTGKSMLIKKLETTLIKLRNSTDQNYNFIPLLVKCNNLDAQNPSIIDYLKKQRLDLSQINALKESDRNKLILLDGYDEYTGEYFRIYSKLNLSDWKNTLVIVTSRKEKLTENDACNYFSIDNEQGERVDEYFTIVKLEEFSRKEIDEYCQKYFQKQRTDGQSQLNQESFDKDLKMMEESLKNKQIENLLQIPINLYLFTRMLVTKEESELKELITNISDQIEIQEIFFQQQFNREAIDFVQKAKYKGDQKDLQSALISAYFEYFQSIAIRMFIQKGKVANFLTIKKSEINFKLQDKLTKMISSDENSEIQNKIKNYVNSKIITRVKEDNDRDNVTKNSEDNTLVEFKHKSLFEYFVARAMKFDFDKYGESIHTLPIEQLKDFNINKKPIMNIGQNQSEQQILIKFYKMVKKEIESDYFIKTYYKRDSSKTNKYIQYLLRSNITNKSSQSQIDTGASNLLSTLFYSKFQFPYLHLSQLSLSKSYIPQIKDKSLIFDKCNLSNAYLKGSNLNFETSNTENACYETYYKIYDVHNNYSFNKIAYGKNNLIYTINKNGFLNCFEANNNNKMNLIKSQRISNNSLVNMNLQNDLFIISSEYVLFMIDISTFEQINTKVFESKIISISLSSKKDIYVNLEDESILAGNSSFEFNKIKETGKQSAISHNGQLLAVIQPNQMKIYDISQDFALLKEIKKQFTQSSFSLDGKYLCAISQDGKCIVFNTAKQYQQFVELKDNYEIIDFQFSSNGKSFATIASYDTVKIWNVETGFKLIQTIENLEKVFTSVSFSSDNKQIGLSNSNACYILALNQNKYIQKIKLEAYKNGIQSIAYCPKSSHLATSVDNIIKVWKINTANKNQNKTIEVEMIITIDQFYQTINSLTYSPDGRYLVSGSSDETSVLLWDVQNGYTLVKTIQEYASSIKSVAFSANQKFLAAVSDNNCCYIFDVEKDFELIHTMKDHTYWIECVKFSPESEYLLTGSKDKSFKIYEVNNDFTLKQTIQDPNDFQINCLAFSEDGSYLATGQDYGFINIWRVKSDFELIKTIEVQEQGDVKSVVFSPEGKYLVAGFSQNICNIWSVEKNFELENSINDHQESISEILYTPEGYLVTCSSDKSFKIWNISAGFEQVQQDIGHTSKVNSIAFSSNSKYLATGSHDQTCKIWNTQKGFQLEHILNEYVDSVTNIAFSQDGRYLSTSSTDRTIVVYDIENNYKIIKKIKAHNSFIQGLQFSFDNKYLASASTDKTVKIWSIEKNFELQTTLQEKQRVQSISFSMNLKFLAVCPEDKTCKIYNPENNFELVNTLTGHKDQILSTAFSNNSKFLATGSVDKTCKIWNTEKNFELIETLLGHLATILCISFSVDSYYLATGSYDRTFKIWNLKKNFELVKTFDGENNSVLSIKFSPDDKYLVTGQHNYCQVWNIQQDLQIQSEEIQNDQNQNSNIQKQQKLKQNQTNNNQQDDVQVQKQQNYLFFNMYTF